MGKPNLVIDKELGKVFLDGECIGEIISYGKHDQDLSIRINDINKLKNISVRSFNEMYVRELDFSLNNELFSRYEFISISNIFIHFTNESFSFIGIDFNIIDWNLPFSFRTFVFELSELLKDNKLISLNGIDDSGDPVNQGLDFVLNEKENIRSRELKTLFYELFDILLSRIDFVISKLNKRNRANKPDISNTFTFPPEIQSSCEQYLIYFATFLKDIGINAETNIESKAQKTLFTVIPKDGEEALDKIKEALHIYLSLPASPEFESAANEFSDMSVQKLASQVYFYKSQLALASSMLQLKDKQIESLNMHVYQQESVVEAQVVEEKNEEEILGGLVTITEFKLNGLRVNSPEMVRFLKRVFRKK